jgi:peroxiredoxin
MSQQVISFDTSADSRTAKWWCYALVMIVCLAFLGCNVERQGLGPGENAPKFTLTSLSGDEVSLESLAGNYVLVNFWAAWCAPCVEEMPQLQELAEQLKDLPFKVVTIAEDEAVPQLAEFRKRFSLTIPILLDTKGDLRSDYKVTGYPETFLIDPSGRIVMIKDPLDGRPTVRLVGPREWLEPAAIGQFRQMAMNQADRLPINSNG